MKSSKASVLLAVVVAAGLSALNLEAAMSSSAQRGARFVANLKDGQPQTIVCYGTSLTASSKEWVDGLRAALNARWPGKATVVNSGLSGRNSATGLANVQDKVVSKNPDAVLIEFSMNDAADSLNTGKTAAQALADAESNLKAIIAAVTNANPSCEIILETMDPYVRVAGSSLSNRTGLEQHVAMYRRVAEENGYLLVDNWPKWQAILAKGEAEYLKLVPDGVHPNALGSKTVTLPSVLRTLGVDVVESARDIPVMRDVDVLVVGGTFGAVSAAVAAKNAGASVFLAAPRRNLAEEVVLPRRLALDASDEPLADIASAQATPSSAKIGFSYSTTAAANSSHPDQDFTKLNDGKRGSAASQSVQYGDSTVTWSITASGDAAIAEVALYYYYRPNNGDFDVASVSLEVSSDGSTYSAVQTTMSSSTVQTGLEYGDECRVHVLALATPTSARYLKLTARRASGASRMLIGEIELNGEAGAPVVVPLAPLVYEKALDARLKDADVQFLAGAQACDVLLDGSGRVSGAVFADKSGRQAVRAKVVIDATEKGILVRRVASLRPVAADSSVPFTLRMTAKAGLAFDLPGYTVEEGPATSDSITLYTGGDSSMIPSGAETSYAASTYAFTKSFNLAADDWLDVNAIVQRMKTDTWTSSAADVAEVPFYVTPLQMVGAAQIDSWTDAASAPIGAFMPQGVEGLYVLGQMADVSRALAEKLSLPGVETVLGMRIGAAAAAYASARPPLGETALGLAAASAETLVVKERLERPLGIGADDSGAVHSAGGELPVLAVADIAIVGIGTAGGPAAIGALEKGRTVVVVDFLHTAGGVTTEGRIGKYYKGFDRGFSKNRVDAGAHATGWVLSVAKAEWMRRSVVANSLAGVIFGSQAEGVLTDGVDAQGRAVVKGLVVVLPDGTRGVVKASVVIDCSGNAEVAHMAGARTMFLDGSEFSMQGAGTTYHVLGNSYFNTDFGFLNTSDAGDLSNFARRARAGAKSGRYNVGDPSVSSRERRRIVGDVVVNERDILRRRKWSDTIMHGKSDYDMHGFSVSDSLMYRERPHGTEFQAEVPYRALIPADLEGVLATGLGISATRDAMPIIRMQRDVQNQGYAAGLAAAAAISAGSVRTIDVRAIQQELVAGGSLDGSVLSDEDNDVSDEALASAVTNLSTNQFAGIEKILERPADARPLLSAAYEVAEDDAHRLACAIALVLVGDNSRLDAVVSAAETADWSKGFDFRGLGNYGRQTAPVDYLIYTLARSGATDKVLPVLKTLAAKIVANDGSTAKLSHVRMVTSAVEALRSQELFDVFTNAVGRATSLTGWATNSVAAVPAHDVSGNDNSTDDAERTRCIKELAVARTLSRFGVASGTDILDAYRSDVRTIYSSYADLALGLSPISMTPIYEKVAPSLVDEGDFTPTADSLPTNNRDKQDKRSVRDADWLSTNFSTWTFGPGDNNGSGIFNNGSWFSNNSQLGKIEAGNLYGAFLRIASNAGPGRISSTIVAPADHTRFTVLCRYTGRYVGNTIYKGGVALEVDGRRVATSPIVETWSLWPTFKAKFIVSKAGNHEIAFVPVASDDGTCDILIDKVEIGYEYPVFGMFVTIL